ncbi:hypothetical protein EV189_2818 [Motilibacter rhizosphaerae]|uniref:FlgD-like protein n=1 Tax=Motilibacter rhizosphaerae TaxID=598652 RepID=A0A4Q7NRW4_9ACTN|nr:hypothetical protein [Motilibacter rhizosphaerae]RZS87390.1 hypothetical protein EV189_2818 [Motilibacter rhizosphaerae]
MGRIALPVASTADPGTPPVTTPPVTGPPVTSPPPAPRVSLCAVSTHGSCRSTVGARAVRVAARLDRRATLTLSVQAPAARGKRATKPVRVLSRTAARGTTVLSWDRRVGRRAAGHGTWTLVVTATAGGRSTTARLRVRL